VTGSLMVFDRRVECPSKQDAPKSYFLQAISFPVCTSYQHSSFFSRSILAFPGFDRVIKIYKHLRSGFSLPASEPLS